MNIQVSLQWREAAEEVRAHLTALRGGGAFLSPADAWQLVQWLEQGIDVTLVLIALERASEARRRKRTRVPLSLVSAKRHLGKPGHTPFRGPAPSRESPLASVVRSLQITPITVDGPARSVLVKKLLAVDKKDPDGVRTAIAATRDFFEEVWDELGDSGREVLRETARTDLGDLVQLVDEAELLDLVEEGARDALRTRYPGLGAATFAALLG